MEPHLRALRTRWKRRSRGFGVHCGGCAGATSGGWSLAVGLDANLLSIEGVGPWQLAFFARCWRVGWHRLLRGALYLVGEGPCGSGLFLGCEVPGVSCPAGCFGC